MENITTSEAAIAALMKYLGDNPESAAMLLESLLKARYRAKQNLDGDLFDLLEFPITIKGYETYLTEFSKWEPQQGGNEGWTDPETGQTQEVFDRICHFYWLVNQKVGPEEILLQSIPLFSEWLVVYVKCWGGFLSTTDSFSNEALQSFIDNSPQYHVEDSMIDGKPNNPSGWLTFNQFFARQLNLGLREVANPFDNSHISSPADCTYKQNFFIGPNSEVLDITHHKCAITFKKTNSIGNIKDLIEGSVYADQFAGGTMVHYFLAPYSYHRFHCPVNGTVKESFKIRGRVYLDVKITDGQFDAPDDATDGYEFNQMRGVLTIDTAGSPSGDIGIVAIIPVGMAQVSSVTMLGVPNKKVLKGDGFGYFMFGGSDIVVLFQNKANVTLTQKTENYLYYGQEIATASVSGK